MRVGLIQMRCEKNAIAQNLDSMADCIAEAAARQVDILAFPEMCLTGYADPTKSPQAALTLDGPEVAQLLHLTQGFAGTVLAGFIEANPDGKPFITHIAAKRGELVGFYRKITIVGDEADWFSPGWDVPVFEQDTCRFGIAICADLTNQDVFAQSCGQGVHLVFELAAPGLYGEQRTRNWQASYEWWAGECQKYLSRYAQKYGIWVLVATQAGRTVDEDFPGGAFVFAPNGERVFTTLDGSAGAVFLELDLNTGRIVVLA